MAAHMQIALPPTVGGCGLCSGGAPQLPGLALVAPTESRNHCVAATQGAAQDRAWAQGRQAAEEVRAGTRLELYWGAGVERV